MSLCEFYEFVSTTRCKGTSYYKVELTGLIDNHGEERTCIATAQVYDIIMSGSQMFLYQPRSMP